MTAIAITGTTGASKTYTAVNDHIMPALRDGRRVVTNCRLKLVNIAIALRVTSANIEVVDQDDLRDPDSWPEVTPGGTVKPGRLIRGGELIVIDEMHTTFPPGRGVGKSVPERIVSFFRMHRHARDRTGRSTDIVLIGQTPDDIHGDLVPVVHRHDLVVNLERVAGSAAKHRYKIDHYDRLTTAESARLGSSPGKLRTAAGHDLYLSVAHQEGGTGIPAFVESPPKMSGRIKKGLAFAAVGLVVAGYMSVGAYEQATASKPAPKVAEAAALKMPPPISPDEIYVQSPQPMQQASTVDVYAPPAPEDRYDLPVDTRYRVSDGRIYFADVLGDSYQGASHTAAGMISKGWQPLPGPCGGVTLLAPNRKSVVHLPGDCGMSAGSPPPGGVRASRNADPAYTQLSDYVASIHQPVSAQKLTPPQAAERPAKPAA